MSNQPPEDKNPEEENEQPPSLRAFVDAQRKAEEESGEWQQIEDEQQPVSSAGQDTPPHGTPAVPPASEPPMPHQPVYPATPAAQPPPPPPPLDPHYAQPIKPRKVRLDEHGMPLPPSPEEEEEWLQNTQAAPSVPRGGETIAHGVVDAASQRPTTPGPGRAPTTPASPAPGRAPTDPATPAPATRGGDTGKPPRPPESRGRRIWRTIWRITLIGLGVGLVLSFAGAIAAILYYIQIINTVDFPSGPNAFEQLQADALQFETTRIYDSQGNVLYEINDPSGGRRDYVTLDEISPWLIHATVATEDENFFTNPGFSIPAIARAVYQASQEQEVVSGASTITQQLTRALLLPPDEAYEVSVERKIKEIFISAELSRRFSKEEILELYLNQIYYGNLAYGIEAASQTYFDKSASELTLAEASFLAGIPQAPALWDPVTNLGGSTDPEAPSGVIERQDQVARLMIEAGGDGCVGPMADGTTICVTEQDITANVPDFIAVRSREYHRPIIAARYPHWVVYIQQQLETLYQPEQIYTSGFDVYTTLDPALQDIAQEQVDIQLASIPPERNVTNAAVVAIDPHTGAILAMVGSANFDDETIDGQVNVAITPRQPGSSIKPIVYLAAFEKGWTPATVIWDTPIEYEIPGFGVYAPRNYDDRFHGPQPLRASLANSYNTPAVQALDFVGIEPFLQKAYDLGIASLGVLDANAATQSEWESVPGVDPVLALQIVSYRDSVGGFEDISELLNVPGIDDNKFSEMRGYLRVRDYGLAASLGAGEVAPVEMAEAFATMANGGVHHDPYGITRIELNGVTVYQHDPGPGTQAIPAADAYLISDILSDNAARTPAFGPNSVLATPFTAAAKTGTTNDYRDNWTVGYHPNLAVAVWVGNADNSEMIDISGVTGAGPIWRGVIENALLLYPSVDFVAPPDIVTQTVCNDSGSVPSVFCTRTHVEKFSAAHPPPGPEEDIYRELLVDEYTGLIANAFCPEFQTKRFYIVVPDHARTWLLENSAGQGWLLERGFKPEDVRPAPEDECEEGMIVPVIAIDAPAEGEWLDGTFQIRGSVQAEGFESYIVQVGEGPNPDIWFVLQDDTSIQVKNGVLATWNTANFPDGTYTIRLVMFGEGDREITRTVTVNVAHEDDEPEPEPAPPAPEETKEPPDISGGADGGTTDGGTTDGGTTDGGTTDGGTTDGGTTGGG